MHHVLYLGLDPSRFSTDGKIIHYPVIRIEPRQGVEIHKAFSKMQEYTHLVFTSQNAVRIFFSYLPDAIQLGDKLLIAIGTATSFCLEQKGYRPLVAEIATQEGVVSLLETLALEDASVFLPGSSLSRPILSAYLAKRKVPFVVCPIYDTVFQKLEPVPSLASIQEIVFTSPSTVDGFLRIFPSRLQGKKIRCIGEITASYVQKKIPCIPCDNLFLGI